MKVANRLVRAGILRASRGRNGGLALARPAEEPWVDEVIRASEHDFALVGCTAGERCLIAPGCRLVSVLGSALADFRALANRYKLADIAHAPARTPSTAVQNLHTPHRLEDLRGRPYGLGVTPPNAHLASPR